MSFSVESFSVAISSMRSPGHNATENRLPYFLLRLPHCSGEASFARELVISSASILKTRLKGYDLPCRVRESEFAAILRQANALEAHQRALLINNGPPGRGEKDPAPDGGSH
jgi:hypothetical protein